MWFILGFICGIFFGRKYQITVSITDNNDNEGKEE